MVTVQQHPYRLRVVAADNDLQGAWVNLVINRHLYCLPVQQLEMPMPGVTVTEPRP